MSCKTTLGDTGSGVAHAARDARFREFLARFPGYGDPAAVEALRRAEYGRLDEAKQVYLDYTGGGLYAKSQLDAHMAQLRGGVYGNPHSTNPSSHASTVLVDETRAAVLEYFNADPSEYTAVFTANASGALKIVGESYPFERGRYLLAFDNHNSVNGIREFAKSRGADVTYIPVELPDLRISKEKLVAELDRPEGAAGHRLFSYPAQSNFSAVQHPLEWIALAQSKGWDVLLDAAAFVPTNRLDLGTFKPEFVSLSFYKIFGYPTGLGAFIVKKSALARLRKPWFAGGTITVASVQGDRYYLERGPAGFEDGTLNYLGIPAIRIGLDHIKKFGIETIHERVMALTGWMLEGLMALKHGNGKPLLRFYGPLDLEARGGGVTVNFFDAKGSAIDHRAVEAAANSRGISLRTGCFCNPGAGEIALGISKGELLSCFGSRIDDNPFTVDDLRGCLLGKSNGAVRISTGIASNFQDVETLLEFAASFIEA